MAGEQTDLCPESGALVPVILWAVLTKKVPTVLCRAAGAPHGGAVAKNGLNGAAVKS